MPMHESLVLINSYDQFDLLPHQPKGVPSGPSTINVCSLDHTSGELKRVSELAGIVNPAFMRYHQSRDGSKMIYVCTESIKEMGTIVGLKVDTINMTITRAFEVSAEGYSTCYVTINPEQTKAYIVNYWDSVLGTYDIQDNGVLTPMVAKWKPEKRMVAQHLDDHLHQRQSEPHTHALVFDPWCGRVVYVPDLGDDVVRQYVVGDGGGLVLASVIPAGKQRGPRYIQCHPSLPIAYVVNELSSSISVNSVDIGVVSTLQKGDPRSTLTIVQEISTLPEGFDDVRDDTGHGKNTCGRVMCTKDGSYVLASNRGHDSISVHKVDRASGLLTEVGIYLTHGKTPRHFQLSCDGKFVIVANQDSETVEVFHMDQSTGVLTHTGNSFSVPSPNFVLAEAPMNLRPVRGA